ncbi:Hypothetical_protein [Hexamita inflata]|uniref:Hypothetical_protein n=1 Tax=Hexamita inflata TaxID=28002 RepID=A0AA86U1J1_9EUKA|nr:Hypothetical protein HINF_LOCUS24271 [Hexamita inflata]
MNYQLKPISQIQKSRFNPLQNIQPQLNNGVTNIVERLTKKQNRQHSKDQAKRVGNIFYKKQQTEINCETLNNLRVFPIPQANDDSYYIDIEMEIQQYFE